MPQGNLQFIQLNSGWNADPNVPLPRIELDSGDLLLIFRLNAFQFANFREDDLGILRFVSCTKYHLGGPNDEGWYLGQCRFSKLAPAWGEFYRIQGETFGLASPEEWKLISHSHDRPKQHYLFYFREETFECFADTCHIEPNPDNALIGSAALPS